MKVQLELNSNIYVIGTFIETNKRHKFSKESLEKYAIFSIINAGDGFQYFVRYGELDKKQNLFGHIYLDKDDDLLDKEVYYLTDFKVIPEEGER